MWKATFDHKQFLKNYNGRRMLKRLWHIFDTDAIHFENQCWISGTTPRHIECHCECDLIEWIAIDIFFVFAASMFTAVCMSRWWHSSWSKQQHLLFLCEIHVWIFDVQWENRQKWIPNWKWILCCVCTIELHFMSISSCMCACDWHCINRSIKWFIAIENVWSIVWQACYNTLSNFSAAPSNQ